jgi:hypothetical protein
MASRDEILRIVREQGPIIPNDIKKEVGGDTFLISAILSEMVVDKVLRITNTKIGSGPAYYAPGQEPKLQELSKYLNEKDKRAFELLRQKMVIRDGDEDPLIRVCLRNIKDFAKQLEVNVRGEKEIFWKWYLAPKEEVENRIRSLFATAPKSKPAPVQTSQPEPKKETPISNADSARRTESSSAQKQEQLRKPEPEIEKEEKVIEKKKDSTNDDFLKQLTNYFDNKQIEIVEEKIIRKNSDIELEILIPTAVGKVKYFCKAKNKKKCNDGDLSSAYLSGQNKKLPIIFITTGEVTKKAQDKLETEFKGLVVKII